MAYLNAITKTIKQIQDSDEDTRDRYNYHRGLSLHMIKKLMGADHSQWGYINNAGKILISLNYLTASDFKNGLALVEFEKNDWGYIDVNGQVVWRSNSN